MKIFDRTGQKIRSWTVIKIVSQERRKIYLVRCECGTEKTINSGHISRLLTCQACNGRNIKAEHDARKGERNGKLTCLGHAMCGARHGYLIQCDCGTQYIVNCYSQFKKTASCFSCKRGYYPGLKIGNCTLIKRIKGTYWEKKCECGTVFLGYPRKTNCGCLFQKRNLAEAENKIGLKYKMLTVKSIMGKKDGHIQLLIKCKCGNEFIRNNGHEFKSESCGCLLKSPVGEKASKATLRNCEVASIREFHQAGTYTLEQLADMFKKSKGYITRIIKKEIWKHV
jgi:hypothetical protein